MPRYENESCIWFLPLQSIYEGAEKLNLKLIGDLNDAKTVPTHDDFLTGFSQWEDDNLVLSPINLIELPVIEATRFIMW